MSKAHVLVVDDDIPILTALKKTLSLEGYAVDVAGAVGIAEEHLAKRSYDIALFDVALPDGDGVSLLERLRKAKNDIPVVMMSGHATVDAAVRATRPEGFPPPGGISTAMVTPTACPIVPVMEVRHVC